jgi:hypothetical protein
MAGFFDPDAPARPIRIALPLDTSPAGLRKFDKNTAFMISDMLCGQIDRVKGLTLGDLVLSVLPWPFHQDLPVSDPGACTDDAGLEIGMVCSLSIPIITICALLMLMIIVTLLDIFFCGCRSFYSVFRFRNSKARTEVLSRWMQDDLLTWNQFSAARRPGWARGMVSGVRPMCANRFA